MLVLKNISLRRGNSLVLDRLNASAEAGKITILLGVNGCGKTSLLGGISGILPLESGGISLDGVAVNPASSEWRSRFSYIFDDGGTIPLLSIEEQLLLQCMVNGVEKAEAAGRTDSVIRLLNLEKHRGYRADELSAGLKKRLGIGLGIIRNAEIFLFDEPFSSLDLQSGALISEILQELKNLGKTVILSTHSPSYLSGVFDSVWLLADGHITARDGSYQTPVTFDPVTTGAAGTALPWMTTGI